MKYIATLLTVYNRKEQTLSCLKNLFAQVLSDDDHLDVFLTNDGCTDGTPEAIREQYPQVNIIDGNGTLFWNRGMWTAWNAAAKTKDYDYYLWLNDDTFLYYGGITKLLLSSQAHSDQCIIVGATESLDKTHITYGGWDKKGQIIPASGTECACTTLNGNIVLVPKHVFNKIGNLDYYYRHSGGDTDYGLTATKNGIGIFQPGEYLGACDEHPTLSTWCNPNVPLSKRLKNLYKPNGQPPHELYHLEAKFYGKCIATFHFITTHIHCLMPKLWWLIKR